MKMNSSEVQRILKDARDNALKIEIELSAGTIINGRPYSSSSQEWTIDSDDGRSSTVNINEVKSINIKK